MRCRTAALCLTSLVLALSPLGTSALAQDDPTSGGRRGLSRDDGVLLAIDFEGGSLESYIDALKSVAITQDVGVPVNVIIDGDTSGCDLGPVSLEGVTIETALRVAEREIGRLERPGDELIQIGVRDIRRSSGGAPVYSINIHRQGGSHLGRNSTPDVLVVSLKEMTTSLPGDPPELVVNAETVLTAIETAIEVASANGPRGELRYHPESGLLIMSGDLRTLGAADEVIGRIKSDIRERRTRAVQQQQVQGLTNPEALEMDLADARAEADLMRVQMETAQRRLQVMMERYDETRQLAEEGMISTTEIRTQELQLHESEAEIQERQIMLQRALDRVDHAEGALKRAREIASGGGTSSTVEELRKENDMLRDRLATLEAQLADLQARSRRGGN